MREERFPTLATKAYLSTGSYGLLSVDVRDAYRAYLDDRMRCGADWPGWVERIERVRGRLAALIGAAADEIAITGSASEGMNALASAIDFPPERNRVLVSDFEFPTTGQIWLGQAPRGAEIVPVMPGPDGYIAPERFGALIDERTRLVVITHVCYRNGAKLDVREIARLAHAHGALVLLDCYQSVGVEPVDVKALGVDFAAGGMLKYLLGSAGMGFLYADIRHCQALTPTATGWSAQADMHAMDHRRNDPAPDARRFQAGTPPVPSGYAALAGLDIIHEVGIDAIAARVRNLVLHCLDRLAAAGFATATPAAPDRRGPLVTVRATDAPALVDRLAQLDVIVSSRGDNIRAGFHFYNDTSDIDRLIDGLERNRDLIVPL